MSIFLPDSRGQLTESNSGPEGKYLNHLPAKLDFLRYICRGPSLDICSFIAFHYSSSSLVWLLTMAKQDMEAVVFKGKLQVAVEKRPYPSIQKPTDVILKVHYTALCGR